MTRPSTDSRSAVLDAALRLLRDEGPTALRVRRVAAEAGCSTMGVYTYFGGKEGLIEALWLDGFRRFGATIDAVPKRGAPLARLRRMASAYRVWAIEHPTQYQLMFGRSVPEFVASPEARAEAAGAFEILVRAVAAAQAAGELGGGEPGQLALALWAVGHGLVMIELAGIAPEIPGADPDRTYRLAVDSMLAGLAGMAVPAGGRIPRLRSDPPQE